MIRVAVAGAAGRMGETVCAAVEGAEDMELAGRADPLLGTTLEDVLADADVLVDFTRPDTALANALACLRAGVHVVDRHHRLRPRAAARGTRGRRAPAANVLIAPNFAIGAVLMMRFAARGRRAHGRRPRSSSCTTTRKLDAPSGTAARTAELMAAASGGAAPPIHSVRLPGLVAHQEVILGDLGQTLTIRHDTISRESFMPGVLLAVRRVAARPSRSSSASSTSSSRRPLRACGRDPTPSLRYCSRCETSARSSPRSSRRSTRELRVNEEAFVALMHHLAENGSDGFVVAGTTGEASTLTDEEQLGLIELAVAERPRGRDDHRRAPAPTTRARPCT